VSDLTDSEEAYNRQKSTITTRRRHNKSVAGVENNKDLAHPPTDRPARTVVNSESSYSGSSRISENPSSSSASSDSEEESEIESE